MEVLFLVAFAAFAGGIGALSVYFTRESRRVRVEAWRVAGGGDGLEDCVLESWGGPHLVGRAGPLRVRFQECAVNRQVGTRVVVDCGSDITLKRESPATAFQKTMAGLGEVEIGDEEFDRHVYVRGM